MKDSDIINLEEFERNRTFEMEIQSLMTPEISKLLTLMSKILYRKVPSLLIPTTVADFHLGRMGSLEDYLDDNLCNEAGTYFGKSTFKDEQYIEVLPLKGLECLEETKEILGVDDLGSSMVLNYLSCRYFIDSFNGVENSYVPSRKKMFEYAVKKNDREVLHFFERNQRIQFPCPSINCANSNYEPFE